VVAVGVAAYVVDDPTGRQDDTLHGWVSCQNFHATPVNGIVIVGVAGLTWAGPGRLVVCIRPLLHPS